jgi:hypothetical protein
MVAACQMAPLRLPVRDAPPRATGKSGDGRLRWMRQCSAFVLVRVKPTRAGPILGQFHAQSGWPISHLDPRPKFNDASRRYEEVVRG